MKRKRPSPEPLSSLPDGLGMEIVGTLDYGVGIRYDIPSMDYSPEDLRYMGWNTIVLVGLESSDIAKFMYDGKIDLGGGRKMIPVDNLDNEMMLVHLKIPDVTPHQAIQVGQVACISRTNEGAVVPYGTEWFHTADVRAFKKVLNTIQSFMDKYGGSSNPNLRAYYVVTVAPSIKLLAYVDHYRRTMDRSGEDNQNPGGEGEEGEKETELEMRQRGEKEDETEEKKTD